VDRVEAGPLLGCQFQDHRCAQRTDSTHVLAAVRRLNRLELTAGHLRAALNALVGAAPEWPAGWVAADWFDRYGRRVEDYRLPRGEQSRAEYAERTGDDGMRLLGRACGCTPRPGCSNCRRLRPCACAGSGSSGWMRDG
jgi:hypothetical protein